ncbi:helix-turn-helix domain-containing protein [Nocardia sp. NPDC057440]|uniref:helix-turn-helix domain-containing protein n=1 Tax=Nocardia sp. NPDC057440 TaxID=3346134 RepID=UPI0036727945
MGAFARKPMDRFEWERIIRRLRIPAKDKYLALMLATYAESDGSRVFPGVDRLALVMCTGTATVKRQLATLRDLGLVERVKQGNRHAGLADEYRLTIPLNLSDFPMLTPEEQARSGDQ